MTFYPQSFTAKYQTEEEEKVSSKEVALQAVSIHNYNFYFFQKPKAVHKTHAELSTDFVHDRNQESASIKDHVQQETGKNTDQYDFSFLVCKTTMK